MINFFCKLFRYFLRELKLVGFFCAINLLITRIVKFIFLSKDKKKYYRKNNEIFKIFNISREKTEQIYKETIKKINIDSWQHSTNLNKIKDGSIHHLIFCGLKSLNFNPVNILEIGTYTGESTEFLSKLFPNSRIYSVDLPESDPIYKKYFNYEIQNYLNCRLKIIKNLDNVKLIKTNTAFLMNFNLPKMDLIWNDGDMFYPDIAWENVFLYSLLNENGFLLNDDVHLEENKITLYKKNYLNILETQKYLEIRIMKKFHYFFKNENYSQNILYPKRISILKK